MGKKQNAWDTHLVTRQRCHKYIEGGGHTTNTATHDPRHNTQKEVRHRAMVIRSYDQRHTPL